jgi:hypothetical protein
LLTLIRSGYGQIKYNFQIKLNFNKCNYNTLICLISSKPLLITQSSTKHHLMQNKINKNVTPIGIRPRFFWTRIFPFGKLQKWKHSFWKFAGIFPIGNFPCRNTSFYDYTSANGNKLFTFHFFHHNNNYYNKTSFYLQC